MIFQKDNLQFVQGPSVQGLKKPQVRGRGLKIGEGREKRQSEEEGYVHCKEVTAVKSTLESILLPTFKEGQAQHGRSRVQKDQYGLLKAVNVGWSPISHSFSKEKRPFAFSPNSAWESLERLQACLERPDRRLGRPSLA